MPKKRRTRLEMLGLMKVNCPAATHKILVKRVYPFHRLHFTGQNVTLLGLPAAVDRFGTDCYLQGLMDGAAIGAKNPIQLGELTALVDDR